MNAESAEFDFEMSRRALHLAGCGVGQVSPSPLVGCVIVDKNNEIAGEGCYIYNNLTHAEVIALEQAGDRARGGTAYVSLEPHSHYGRTPPCTEALIKAGVRRVVCPIEDPNPLVSGQGFERLRQAGIEVVTGILKTEAERLNEKFIYWHKRGRPFVHLKIAASLDGRIATRTGDSRWITNESSRARAHELRHEYDAILIGSNTALTDDPVLTDRSGKTRRRPLLRVILDDSLRLSPVSKLAQTAGDFPTIVFTANEDSEKIDRLQAANVQVKRIFEGGRNLTGVLEELVRLKVQSLLVEGGAAIAGAFCDAGLIDKFTFFLAPLVIGGKDARTAVGGNGAQNLADAARLGDVEINRHGGDFEITGYPLRNQ